jgi:hypothetical protein
VELEVEPGDVLRLTAHPATRSGAARVLKSAGWKSDTKGPLVHRWPSPVRVIVAVDSPRRPSSERLTSTTPASSSSRSTEQQRQWLRQTSRTNLAARDTS